MFSASFLSLLVRGGLAFVVAAAVLLTILLLADLRGRRLW